MGSRVRGDDIAGEARHIQGTFAKTKTAGISPGRFHLSIALPQRRGGAVPGGGGGNDA
jgi:hypothetical protein